MTSLTTSGTEAPDAGAESPRRQGRAAMPEAERHRILREAAAEVFLRDGYAVASMDEVARRAGMSKRTLYQFFPSKTALFEAALGATLAPLHLDSRLEDEPDTERGLTGILEAAGRHLLAPRQVGVFRLVIAETQRSPELAEATLRVMLSRGASSLERRIAMEVARGRLRVADPNAAARMLYGMALAATHMMMLLGLRGPPDEQEIAHLARDAVAVFLRGATIQPHCAATPPIR